MRLEKAAGADTSATEEQMRAIKPASLITLPTFLNNISKLVDATGDCIYTCMCVGAGVGAGVCVPMYLCMYRP